MIRIGIDMGGTNLRAALVDQTGIIRKEIVPCPANAEDPAEVLEALASLISSIITDEVRNIGIGVPSVVDVEKGIVYNVTNIPCWKEVHLKDYLEQRFPGVHVCVNNDANCFALAEARYGAARGLKDVVGITLGTGTGAGIVIDGKLYNGANVGAGEICYLPYGDSYIENYTSGNFFKRFGLSGKKASALARSEAATAGQTATTAYSPTAGQTAAQDFIPSVASAQSIWEEFGRHVGALIKMVMLAYDPQAVVIGGGIAAEKDLYEHAMRESLKDFWYPVTAEKLILKFSELQDGALLGAASLD